MFTDAVAAGRRHVLCLGLFVSVTACAVREEEFQHFEREIPSLRRRNARTDHKTQTCTAHRSRSLNVTAEMMFKGRPGPFLRVNVPTLSP